MYSLSKDFIFSFFMLTYGYGNRKDKKNCAHHLHKNHTTYVCTVPHACIYSNVISILFLTYGSYFTQD